MPHKSSKGFKEKLKKFFFGKQKKKEDIKISRGTWKEKEGSKWVYFKERADEDDIFVSSHCSSVIEEKLPEQKSKAEKDKQEVFSEVDFIRDIADKGAPKKVEKVGTFIGGGDGSDDGMETFSVTEFAKKFGHRGEGPKEPVKESPEDGSKKAGEDKKEKVSSEDIYLKKKYPEIFLDTLEMENVINKYVEELETDPFNVKKRTKLIRLYLEKKHYSRALKECYSIVTGLEEPKPGLVFCGDVSSLSPFYIFQVLVSSKKNGRLDFFLAGENSSVFFLQGKAVHAKDMWGTGEEVIKRILIWREGLFNFVPDELPIELTITRSTQRILSQLVGIPMKTGILQM